MIAINDLTKCYGEKCVFRGLTFKITENCRTVFGGESGIGKTTLMRCISGLETPDGGSVTGTAGKKASFVFQDNRLIPGATAMENILCVAPGRERAEYLLGRAGLADAAEKKAEILSGGMKRRLSIVRSLAYGGDIFYFDEPLRELDKTTERRMIELIKEETAGKTVILITHDTDQSDRLADTAIMFEGKPMRIVSG